MPATAPRDAPLEQPRAGLNEALAAAIGSTALVLEGRELVPLPDAARDLGEVESGGRIHPKLLGQHRQPDRQPADDPGVSHR
jgi:hypothetical protein